MPEGHTLYRVASELDEAFAGRPVRASSPQGRFVEQAAHVDGQEVTRAHSAGKHVFVEFRSGDVIHVHLGLIGAFTFGTMPAPPPVGAVRLRLEGEAAYADLRGATVCELVDQGRVDEVLARLGPDPLRPDADPDAAYRRIHRSRKSIAALLMDQSVLSGVGNVFRAEVLFRAGLSPSMPGRRLSRARWDAMWDDLVDLMEQGVRTGRIDTVRPEHEPAAMGRPPRVDDHGGEVYVYRRAGQPCYVCGETVRTRIVEGRNLFLCPGCQRRR